MWAFELCFFCSSGHWALTEPSMHSASWLMPCMWCIPREQRIHICKGHHRLFFSLRLLAPSQIFPIFRLHLEIIYLCQIIYSDCCHVYVSLVSTDDLLRAALSRLLKKHLVFLMFLLWKDCSVRKNQFCPSLLLLASQLLPYHLIKKSLSVCLEG